MDNCMQCNGHHVLSYQDWLEAKYKGKQRPTHPFENNNSVQQEIERACMNGQPVFPEDQKFDYSNNHLKPWKTSQIIITDKNKAIYEKFSKESQEQLPIQYIMNEKLYDLPQNNAYHSKNYIQELPQQISVKDPNVVPINGGQNNFYQNDCQKCSQLEYQLQQIKEFQNQTNNQQNLNNTLAKKDQAVQIEFRKQQVQATTENPVYLAQEQENPQVSQAEKEKDMIYARNFMKGYKQTSQIDPFGRPKLRFR